MFKSFVVLLVIGVVVKCAPQGDLERPRFDGRIVGGDDADIEDYPYQLSLLNGGSHTCGASIISEKWALTAGHCTEGAIAGALTVRAGSSLLEIGGQVVKVKKVYRHPSFDNFVLDYDMSLLELAENIQLNKSASAIQLVDANTEFAPGTEATVTGWGIENQWDYILPSKLQVVKVPLISNEECEKEYGDEQITDRMICAGFTEGGKDACQGDSGGPFVVDGKLAGIVSWGYGCAQPEYPGVYSKIAPMRDFITEITGI